MADQLRIVFFADTHLGFDYPIKPRVEMRRRGEDFFRNFQIVLDYAAHTKPDLVVHGGDLFFRSRVPPMIVDLVYAALLKFAENDIPFLIVPGNHERSNLPASLWLSAKSIHVFDQPATLQVSASGVSVAVSGFPFVRDNIAQCFEATLKETGWQDNPAAVKLLIMHQTVEGAQVGPSNYTFRAGPDVLKMSDIPPDFVAVLSGHIHRRQILRRPEAPKVPPVVYAGSTERTSFAEKDEPKGFYDLRFGRDQSGRWRMLQAEFRSLPVRPMVELDIDCAVSPSSLHHQLRESIAELDPNAIVKLRCRGRIDRSVAGRFTASFLRSVFPSSMNVQLGTEFYPEIPTNAIPGSRRFRTSGSWPRPQALHPS